MAWLDSYRSDPAKPVPYLPRPVRSGRHLQPGGRTWLTTDQRSVADRPDVLVYETAPLTAPVRISGSRMADLVASTTRHRRGLGGEADRRAAGRIVPADPSMGGYELPVGMDIFRGRYRQDFAHPAAIPAGQVERYRFTLPPTNHVFLPGHRIMVQVQSSWFPLYDRNPQTYVPNIFEAKAADYQPATMQVVHAGAQASAVWLPLVK